MRASGDIRPDPSEVALSERHTNDDRALGGNSPGTQVSLITWGPIRAV